MNLFGSFEECPKWIVSCLWGGSPASCYAAERGLLGAERSLFIWRLLSQGSQLIGPDQGSLSEGFDLGLHLKFLPFFLTTSRCPILLLEGIGIGTLWYQQTLLVRVLTCGSRGRAFVSNKSLKRHRKRWWSYRCNQWIGEGFLHSPSSGPSSHPTTPFLQSGT